MDIHISNSYRLLGQEFRIVVILADHACLAAFTYQVASTTYLEAFAFLVATAFLVGVTCLEVRPYLEANLNLDSFVDLFIPLHSSLQILSQ